MAWHMVGTSTKFVEFSWIAPTDIHFPGLPRSVKFNNGSVSFDESTQSQLKPEAEGPLNNFENFPEVINDTACE